MGASGSREGSRRVSELRNLVEERVGEWRGVEGRVRGKVDVRWTVWEGS